MPGPRQIQNELVQDESSVLVLPGHQTFGYSDGAASEKYLEEVFRKAKDLRAGSSELEGYIKDWASEYHLTAKRAQLLSGFRFDRTMKVLEVGCGCGAITRFLGETFDHVTSVEGSLHRARLARLRTRDLTGVTVVCAPFQELRFAEKFDLIVCVGVFEYSAAFVEGPDPYDAVLRYFSDLLTPDGMVLIAIENQFGLKYFSSSREDHLGTMFEGIEGYHAHPGKVRTFGRVEIQEILQPHFPNLKFFYPYPDYKIPDCVLSEEFLASGKAGELVSQQRSRDYAGQGRPLWDETLVSLELARNKMLPFFSNSFLILGGKGDVSRVAFDQLAILFSSGRAPVFRTRTRVLEDHDRRVIVAKTLLNGAGTSAEGPLRLVDTTSTWHEADSLHTLVYLRVQAASATLEEVFRPCKAWLDLLHGLAREDDGEKYLDGEHVDLTWSNVYLRPGGVEVIDREWIWDGRIGLNAMVIRAIYRFVSGLPYDRPLPGNLGQSSGRRAIESIAGSLGVTLRERDFAEFVRLESQFQSLAFGVDTRLQVVLLRWFLMERTSLDLLRRGRLRVRSSVQRAREIMSRLARATGVPGARS